MSPRWLRFTLIACLLALLCVSLVGWLASSIWVVWHLVPTATWKVAATAEGVAALPASLPFPEAVRVAAAQSWRIAYIPVPQPTLVLLPSLLNQRQLPRELAALGWQVQRFGPYVVASEVAPAAPVSGRHVGHALQNAVVTLLTSRWPMLPAVIVQRNQPLAGLSHPFFAVASGNQSEFHLAISPSETTPPLAAPRLTTPSSDTLQISAPGDFWSRFLPEQWNALLWREFGFIRTRPAMSQVLGTFPQATVFKQGDSVALVAYGAGEQFNVTVNSWVQEEDRRGRLVSQVFRLPDGTLGYEKVPGEALAVFSPPDAQGCRTGLEQRTSLWLCQGADQSVVATAKEAALTALAYPRPTGLTVAAGKGAMQELQRSCAVAPTAFDLVLCRLDWVHWQGTPEYQVGSFAIPRP